MKRELVVIGAGPAGISAAAVAARLGVEALVIDENSVLGGRLPGQFHESYDPHSSARAWWNGQERAAELISRAVKAGVEFKSSTMAWGVTPEREVLIYNQMDALKSRPAGAEKVEWRSIILATGAVQVPLIFPGWTLPGVLTVGGAQKLLQQWVMPDQRVLIVGIDALGFAMLSQLRLFGVEVVAMVLPPKNPANEPRCVPRYAIGEMLRLAKFAPSPLLRGVGRFLPGRVTSEIVSRIYPGGGLSVWGTPVMPRKALVGVEGREGVESAAIAAVGTDGEAVGPPQEIEVQTIITSGGLTPLTETAKLVGCEMAHIAELGGWVPLHGPSLETTVPGVFVAGNITGVEGALVAGAQGELAGLGAASYLGRLDAHDAKKRLREARAKLAEARERSDLHFHPQAFKGRELLREMWQLRIRHGPDH